MATQDFAPHKVAASAMNSIAASSCRALKSRGSRTSRKIERRLCMTTLPNQESLLQNQVFLATQYSFTYLRFPWASGGPSKPFTSRPHARTAMAGPRVGRYDILALREAAQTSDRTR